MPRPVTAYWPGEDIIADRRENIGGRRYSGVIPWVLGGGRGAERGGVRGGGEERDGRKGRGEKEEVKRGEEEASIGDCRGETGEGMKRIENKRMQIKRKKKNQRQEKNS